MTELNIIVYSDFICPWCYIGKMRLERVRKTLEKEMKIYFETKPYVLYPHIPIGGAPKSDFAKNTKPGMGRSLRSEADIEQIKIQYKLIDKIPNSLEAHRLIQLIPDLDLKFEVSKDIFHAYFQEGKDIEDKTILSDLAASQAVDQTIIDKFQNSTNGEREVLVDIKNANQNFISLVPTIELTPTLNILGLQPAEVWTNYFRRAAKMKTA